MHADDELRTRFRELRRVDTAGAPGFPTVVDQAEARRARATPYRLPLVWLTAAAAVVVGLFATRFRATSDAAPPSITTWQSPTSSLVPASGRAVLSPPPLLSCVLDGATSSTIWRKGD